MFCFLSTFPKSPSSLGKWSASQMPASAVEECFSTSWCKWAFFSSLSYVSSLHVMQLLSQYLGTCSVTEGPSQVLMHMSERMERWSWLNKTTRTSIVQVQVHFFLVLRIHPRMAEDSTPHSSHSKKLAESLTIQSRAMLVTVAAGDKGKLHASSQKFPPVCDIRHLHVYLVGQRIHVARSNFKGTGNVIVLSQQEENGNTGDWETAPIITFPF